MATTERASAAWLLRGLALLGAAGFGGCRQTSSEYVEAELRVQSKKVSELENRIAQRDAEIEALRNTVTTFQAGHVKPVEAPETVYRDTALSRISLTLATGGKDADLDGKDDGIVVGVAPRDYDGDVFKCPGTCRVQLFETPSSGRRQIGEWAVSGEQLRGLWRTSLLGQGYYLSFGWQTPPTEKRLKVVVAFTTVDGRKFEAEKEFDVSLQPKGPPQAPGARIDADFPMTPAAPAAPPSVPGPQTELPRPRGLGALSNLGGVTSPPAPPARLSGQSTHDPLPPRATTSLPGPLSEPKKPVIAAKPASWDRDHSPPPIVAPEHRAMAAEHPTPGDRADLEDVIVLPKAAAGATAAPSPSIQSAPTIPVAATEPAAPPPPKKLQLDRVALPQAPAPPKAAARFPTTIALPD